MLHGRGTAVGTREPRLHLVVPPLLLPRGEAAPGPLGGLGSAPADKAQAVCGGRDFLPPRLVLALLEGSDELTLDAKAVRRERETHTHSLKHTLSLSYRHIFPEAISVLFSVLCNFTDDISSSVWLLFGNSPRGGAPSTRLPVYKGPRDAL